MESTLKYRRKPLKITENDTFITTQEDNTYMTTEAASITPGELYIDSENGDEVFVLGKSEEKAGDYVATYDYNKEPLSVADLAECDEDATVIEVVYPSQVERLGAALYIPEIERLIDEKKLKVYGFPRERLEEKDGE